MIVCWIGCCYSNASSSSSSCRALVNVSRSAYRHQRVRKPLIHFDSYVSHWRTVSPCELWCHSQRKLTAIWGLGCGRKPNEQREGEVRERLSWRFFCEILNVMVSRDLSPRPWTWAHPGCRLFWSPSCASLIAIRPCLREEAICANSLQTDWQTNDGRRAIALAHWNELIKLYTTRNERGYNA